MGKSKSPAPQPTPQPVVTPIQQKPTEPIQRAASNANAVERAQSNQSADLMASKTEDDATMAANKSSMMG